MIIEKEDRQDMILSILDEKNKIKVSALAKELDFTPETIRRDLAELEEKELLSRVHGGAVPFINRTKELAFQGKLDINREAKIAIAQEAVKRIKDGDVIGVDVGTTTFHLADMIHGVEGITVVTNSIAAAERFNLALEEKRMTGKVLLLGGITNPEQNSVAGAMTSDMLDRIKLDKAFLSSGGITRTAVYDYDIEESLVSYKMLSQSSQSIMLVDSSKVGVTSHFSICPLFMIDEIITDGPCPNEWEQDHVKEDLTWTIV